MTDPGYTHYLLVIDRSGSMHKIREDSEGGIRAFAAEQVSLPGRRTLSLYQFDNVCDLVFDFTSLHKARGYALVPRGGTALLDALGRAIAETGERLAAMTEDQRPGKVIVVVVTDGQENISAEYSRQRVRDMVTEQTERYGWAFTYLGADLSAFAEASSMGFSPDSVLVYEKSSAGVGASYDVLSRSAATYSSGLSSSVTYDAAQRRAAAGEEQ